MKPYFYFFIISFLTTLILACADTSPPTIDQLPESNMFQPNPTDVIGTTIRPLT